MINYLKSMNFHYPDFVKKDNENSFKIIKMNA